MTTSVLRARVGKCLPDALLCLPLDGGAPMRVSYTTGAPGTDFDNSRLRAALSPGMRVNIVDASAQDDGTLRARFIIAEPDYLINATAVVACMTEYGDGALAGLMRKLGPAPNSEALQMGNFAGRLLDEALHGENADKPYAESVRDFFRTAATGIMALGAGFNSARFHSEARRQRLNIAQAVGCDLPRMAPAFINSRAIVEPSFFCEALGLQGRMDCLTLDGSVVVEQKAGKAAFGSRGVEEPLLRREHYAQLLLYRAALRYGHPGTDAAALLMYSRYSRSLVDAGNSEPLLQHAIALRNELALAEISYARSGFGVLDGLTPDMLNTKGAFGTLWTDYQRPQLAASLAPIAAADATERAWFMRMMRFTAMEHMIAKLGNGSRDGSGFASAWLCSAAEKREAGNMLDGLRLVSPAAGHNGKVERITLACACDDGSGSVANFRAADIVLLYSYEPGTEPDLRHALPLRCTVRDISADTLVLELRTPQSDARVLLRDAARPWAIEHDFIESGSDALYRGLHSLLAAPRGRRDLVLARRRPRIDATRSARACYGEFGELMDRTARARELFLIVGPPGTGKTSHGLVNILSEELAQPGTSVLLASYTNRAVDEICSKLEEHGTDYVRLGAASACAEFCRPHTVDAIVGASASLAEVEQRLRGARVFVATTAALNSRIELLAMRRFSLAIIDEASQILEPQLAGIFGAMHGGSPAIERFVLIGDHKQLPAVVRQRPEESRIDEPELRALGFENCRDSFFERMIRLYGDDPEVSFMLTRQGRMHPDIADFPSRFFYGGRLLPVPLPHQSEDTDEPRVRFIAVRPDDSDVSDKTNTAEARVIADIVEAERKRLGDEFDPLKSVGIIIPYRAQAAVVRGVLVPRGTYFSALSVDTVERFQGSQREHIVFGFTVRKSEQLNFLTDSTIQDATGANIDRRLNVALTRARRRLTIVGNPDVLRLNPVFSALIDYCEKKSQKNG